jgi:tetratricopeptide (TPR) repeat protein
LDTYQRLLQVNESSAAARFGMGEVYLAQGERERARFEWREALRLDPNHIESLQRLQEY